MSAGWVLALVASLVLLVMQAAVLPELSRRYEAARVDYRSFNNGLAESMNLDQGKFHLAGTVLLVLGLAGLHAPRRDRALGHAALRRMLPALALPLTSAVVWTWWARWGFRHDSEFVFAAGMSAAGAGLVLPVISAVKIWRLMDRAPEDRRLWLLLGVAVAIWAWSLAFAMMTFMAGVSA